MRYKNVARPAQLSLREGGNFFTPCWVVLRAFYDCFPWSTMAELKPKSSCFLVMAILVCLIPAYRCCERTQDGFSEDTEFSAITAIHKQLDDNADGSVDFLESEEFVQTELCGSPDKEELRKKAVCMSGSEKSLKFHLTDTEITSTELWITWHHNVVFNWTNKDVLEWLINYVELPQYARTFKEHAITGRQLPSIAINSGQMLQTNLLISDSQHKQKIQLRAMDVVLFGPPLQQGYWKDAILTCSVILSVCGIIYVLRNRKLSKSRMDMFMADLRLKEDEIKKLKSHFQDLDVLAESLDGPTDEIQDESSRNSSPILMMAAPCSDEDETSASICRACSSHGFDTALNQAQLNLEILQDRVWSLEEELVSKHKIIQLLQEELPLSQRKEREQLEFRKSIGEEQMTLAQKVCDKIKKKRSSLFGTFHLANSSVLEDAGLQISKALSNMQNISECFEEHHKRWNRIGQLCGFQVTSPTPTENSSRPHSPRGGELSSSLLAQHIGLSDAPASRQTVLKHRFSDLSSLSFKPSPSSLLYRHSIPQNHISLPQNHNSLPRNHSSLPTFLPEVQRYSLPTEFAGNIYTSLGGRKNPPTERVVPDQQLPERTSSSSSLGSQASNTSSTPPAIPDKMNLLLKSNSIVEDIDGERREGHTGELRRSCSDAHEKRLSEKRKARLIHSKLEKVNSSVASSEGR